MKSSTPKPPWLRVRFPSGPQYEHTRRLLREKRLHTVCQEACCPNMFECFGRRTATFLILGAQCTRGCTFCAVRQGSPEPPDPDEPLRVAQAAADMGLEYVVVTSVTRDDLADGGAAQFAATIHCLRRLITGVHVEVLIPDLRGDPAALRTVLAAAPDVLNHNIETVPRLYLHIRPGALYSRSLGLLRDAALEAPRIPTKSGLMLGLGETDPEIRDVLADLRRVRCRILTLGQYLQPTPAHHPVARFIPPEDFDRWRREALAMGFAQVASKPFARSSYQAKDFFDSLSGDASS